MRVLVLTVAASFLLLAFAGTSTSAALPVCQDESADAGLVRASVEYGGPGCTDVSLEGCSLEHDPEYPSHPYWRCEEIL